MSNDNNDTGKYLIESIRLAMGNVIGRKQATWPFGAVLVKDGQVLARAVNQVDELCDPSAHAEMQAVRLAAKAQGSTDLSGAVVYASGYPCPMCLAAMVNSGIEKVYYAFDNQDAAPYDMSSDAAYAALGHPHAYPFIFNPVSVSKLHAVHQALQKFAAPA